MITPVCLVKMETGWNDMATVRSMVAELRPVMGKNALRRAILANTSDASKSKMSARSRRSLWCSWAQLTRFDGGYDERRSYAVAEQGRGEKRRATVAVLLFIAGENAPGVDSSHTSSPRSLLHVNAQESGAKRSAATAAWRRRQAGRWRSAEF